MDIRKYDKATKLRSDISCVDCFIEDLPKIKMYAKNSSLCIFTSMFMTNLPNAYKEEVLDILEKFFIEKRKELMQKFERI